MVYGITGTKGAAEVCSPQVEGKLPAWLLISSLVCRNYEGVVIMRCVSLYICSRRLRSKIVLYRTVLDLA